MFSRACSWALAKPLLVVSRRVQTKHLCLCCAYDCHLVRDSACCSVLRLREHRAFVVPCRHSTLLVSSWARRRRSFWDFAALVLLSLTGGPPFSRDNQQNAVLASAHSWRRELRGGTHLSSVLVHVCVGRANNACASRRGDKPGFGGAPPAGERAR